MRDGPTSQDAIGEVSLPGVSWALSWSFLHTNVRLCCSGFFWGTETCPTRPVRDFQNFLCRFFSAFFFNKASFSAYSFMFWLIIYNTSFNRCTFAHLHVCISRLMHVHRNTCMYFNMRRVGLSLMLLQLLWKFSIVFRFKVRTINIW